MLYKDHKKEQLSAFVNHELSRNVQQQVAEHLMTCPDCRAEHDQVKLGSSLAACLPQQYDAPETVWNAVESELDGRRSPQMALIGRRPFFGPRELVGYATALLIVAGLVAAGYFTLFRAEQGENQVSVAVAEPQISESSRNLPEVVPAVPNEPSANTVVAAIDPVFNPAEPAIPISAWQFETIAGSPKVGTMAGANRIAVGDYLETDAASRARIAVADIGNVEIQPNSLVKLVGTDPKQHRLSHRS